MHLLLSYLLKSKFFINFTDVELRGLFSISNMLWQMTSTWMKCLVKANNPSNVYNTSNVNYANNANNPNNANNLYNANSGNNANRLTDKIR